MTRLLCILLTLLFSLSGPATGEYSDFGRWSNAAKATARAESRAIIPYSRQPTPTSWPGNRGFLGAASDAELSVGTVVDRYGARGGSYVSPAGTPFPMRGLPSTHEALTSEAYEVVSPFRVNPSFSKPNRRRLF